MRKTHGKRTCYRELHSFGPFTPQRRAADLSNLFCLTDPITPVRRCRPLHLCRLQMNLLRLQYYLPPTLSRCVCISHHSPPSAASVRNSQRRYRPRPTARHPSPPSPPPASDTAGRVGHGQQQTGTCEPNRRLQTTADEPSSADFRRHSADVTYGNQTSPGRHQASSGVRSPGVGRQEQVHLAS